uniref:Bax inhibitor-1/YccA family protein n=1 Tax=Metabacillus kandeliae TaxID=2900151 RepID=UPI002F907377
MKVLRTANPAVKAFERRTETYYNRPMTLMGAVHKSFLLLFILVIAAGAAWYYSSTGSSSAGFIAIGGIGGLITALIASFIPKSAPITAPLYAVLEGMAVGGISYYYASQYGGIVMQAILLTISVFAVMLVIYRTGIIKVTNKFRVAVFSATLGIMLLYLVSFVLQLFGIGVPFLHGSSSLSIIISFVIVGVAALNLVLDFDLIERASRTGQPKYMEWYAGFALLVTLVWLYLEILRLLSKLANRN